MKRLVILLAMVAGGYTTSANAQAIVVTSTDGGSVVTDLGYGIRVNKNSSLRRAWVTMNDPSCPVQLSGAGVTTGYGDREYNFIPAGSCEASESVSALEVRYLLYDVFGEHMKTLSGTDVSDRPANLAFPLKDSGEWRAWENEVSELLTVVTFIAQVRTTSGKVWRYQEKAIGGELAKMRLQLSAGMLEPGKEEAARP